MSALEPAVVEVLTAALSEGEDQAALGRNSGGSHRKEALPTLPAPSLSALEPAVVEGGETAALSLAAAAGSSALTEGAATDSGLGLGVPAAPLAPSVSALAERGAGAFSRGADVPAPFSASALDVGQARRQGTTGGTRSPTGGPDDPISFAEKRQPRAACGSAERPSHPFRPLGPPGDRGRTLETARLGAAIVARPNRPMPGKQNPLAASSLRCRGRRSALTAANQPAERLPSS